MIKSKVRELVSRIKNSSFIKNILTLSAGVVVSQSVALITTPIVSRIYEPEVIGDFSIIISNASIASAIICLGLMSAIMIPQEDSEARNLCRLLTGLIVGLSTLLLGVILAVAGIWRMFTVGLDYSVACLILWAYVILTNVSSVYYAYVNRQKMYKVLFWNPTLGTVTNAAVSIVLGLLGCGLWGYALGNISAAVVLIIHMRLRVNPLQKVDQNGQGIVALFSKYRRFPLFQFPANLINTLSQQLPVQLIKHYFGSTILGSYSMCLTILGLPSRFLAGPINRVYYREAAERYNSGKGIGELSYKILVTNIKIAIVPICTLMIFGEPLFSFVLGAKWYLAGSFAAILGIYQLVVFCSSCISGGFIIIGKQKWSLYTSVVNIFINISAFVGGFILFGEIEKVLLAYAILNSLCSLIINGIFLSYSGVSWARYSRFVFLYIVLPSALSYVIRTGLVMLQVL